MSEYDSVYDAVCLEKMVEDFEKPYEKGWAISIYWYAKLKVDKALKHSESRLSEELERE